jgi:hypothetical protein
MRVLWPAYGSRGGVEPLAGLTVRLRVLGAEVRPGRPFPPGKSSATNDSERSGE